MTSLQNWQILLKQGVSNTAELLDLLNLTPQQMPYALQEEQPFKLRVPRGFVDRMEKGNPHDPLLLQALPVQQELISTPGFSKDPLTEQHYNPLPGLLHKYQGRVLFTLTGSCAIHCRYCFRRHFPYADNNPGRQGWQQILDYIAADKNINEVILSGGDPLVMPDNILAELALKLDKIPHLNILRIHSRLPIVLPERINEEFLSWFTTLRLKPVLVIHSNHPNEIDVKVQLALHRLKQAQVVLLNQTVLLKNINNNAATLAELSRVLFQHGVLPYYLHLLDKVEGAAHFDLPLEQAIDLHKELLSLLPGYLVPKLVKEAGGAKSKTPIVANYASTTL